MSNLSNHPHVPPDKDSSSESLNPQRLLSRDEVDSIFGIPKRFLELAACKGNGPAFIKVGRLTRYRVQDVLDWIADHRFHNTAHVDQRKGNV
jgi:hypothetical protein